MNTYSTDELLGVVRSLKRPQRFLSQRYFGMPVTSTSAEVHIDVQKAKRRMAPFVHPRSQGKIVETQGFQTNTIKPAYIKMKTPYDPESAIEFREMGEALTGNLSPAQREMAWTVKTLDDHMDQKDRRVEWMAAQALTTGAITVTGEGFDAIDIDFGRDAGQTKALLGAARWGEAGVDPLADLKAWSLATQQLIGVPIAEWVMEPDAFEVFTQDARVQNLLDNRRGGERASLSLAPAGAAEPQFQGSIGPWDFYTYQDWVVDPLTDVESPLIPQYGVIGGSTSIMGRQHYGAIYDRKAGYAALPFFPKMWENEDPSALFLMSQSAPLLAPWRPDASFFATVR